MTEGRRSSLGNGGAGLSSIAGRLFDAAGVRRAGEAELSVSRERVRRFDARDGALDAVSLSDTLSLSLRLFRDGRCGFSWAFRDGDDDLARMAAAASFAAAAADPDPAHGLPDRAGLPSPSSPFLDDSFRRVDDSARGAFALEVEAAALAADRRVKRVRSATLVESLSSVEWHDSRGRSAAEEQSLYHAWVDVVAEEGAEGQTGYAVAFGRSLASLDPRAIGREAAQRAVRMLGASTVPSGDYPAVLENGAAAELLDVLLPSFLASQAAKGKSMLAGKTGRAVASPRVTVADDPTDGASSGACAFDGEGVPSRRTVLLEDGVLRGFLADSFWGRRLGCGSTASCRRDSAKLPPGPGAGGLRLEGGTEGLPALLGAAGRCILVTEFLGLHTADPVSGDFAVGATGLLCEGGEVVRPLRSFAATGNVLDLLSRVEGAGSDLRWFGTVAAPSLLVSSLSVGGE